MGTSLLYWILASMVQSRSSIISGEKWSYQKRTKQLYDHGSVHKALNHYHITASDDQHYKLLQIIGNPVWSLQASKKWPRVQGKSFLWVIALSLVFDKVSLNIGLLINLIMFPCKYCPELFTALSTKGLTQHHRKCPAYIRHEAEANQCQKTTVTSNKVRWTRTP